MELSNGGDQVDNLVNVAIHENGAHSEGEGVKFSRENATSNGNGNGGDGDEEEELIQSINGKSDLSEHEDIPLNSNCVDCGDDHHTTKADSLNGGGDVEIEKREVIQVGAEESPANGKLDEEDSPSLVNDVTKSNSAAGLKIEGYANVQMTSMKMIRPISQLPKPEAPPGVNMTDSPRDSPSFERSHSLPETITAVDMPTIGKFFRDKSNSWSAAITKRLSSLTEYNDEVSEKTDPNSIPNVTEFNLSGLKVVVKLKKQDDEADPTELKGRISFFSRSNCRDCRAVRSFLRERRLRYVEINIDVFPLREKELVSRTGSSAVPQIFFNEKLFGGLVALNSLRNSGTLEARLKELLSKKCPENAPAPPVYGFDDAEEETMDEMVSVVRVLRQRLPIQDRLMKMKIVKNCFSGAEMVEVLINYFDCGRKKAVEIGKQLARRHFIHHVFGVNEFEDGNHFYRFLEHDPFIPRCHNFRGSTNDFEPKAVAAISLRLTKIMSAILESYASEDGRRLNYVGISNSEEFRRYVNLVQDLHRVNLLELTADEKLAFFLNLYNAMFIHAVIRIGHPGGAVIDRRTFYSDFMYIIGGYPYSLTTIKNGILRNNRRAPYSLVKPYSAGDKRLELAFPKVNPLIHFGLSDGTRSSPPVRFFTPQAIESELRFAAREYFQKDGIEVDLAKRTVYLTRLFKWFSADFGQEKEILKWIINYLDATKAGLVTHLLGDGGPVNIVYQNYDWSVNC